MYDNGEAEVENYFIPVAKATGLARKKTKQRIMMTRWVRCNL